MISIVNKNDCCGCNACGDVCPKAAIRFERDNEGFLYPIIDNGKCVNCGLCESVCPQIHASRKMREAAAKIPKAWAAVSNSLPIRFDSTSGGIFSVLATEVLKLGGYIGGAIWGNQFEILQVVTDRKCDIEKLRSSKYAQSNARGFYNAVKAVLETGKLVFVCGTPCQMMALKLLVGDRDNLLTADFICRGANSPLVMRKYIETFERKHGNKVVEIKQKSKELGWHNLTTKFTFENGDIDYDPRWQSPFMKSFLVYNVISRPSCYACKCKGLSRVTDFTLADCWKIVEQLDEHTFGKDLGTSLVLCHTSKAHKFFDRIQGHISRQPVDVDQVVSTSAVVSKSLEHPVIDRSVFFEKLQNKTLGEVVSELELSSTSLSKHGAAFRMLRWAKHMFTLFYENRRHLFSLAKLNGIRNLFSDRPYFKPHGCVLAQIAPSATMVAKHKVDLGHSVFVGSRLESRVRIDEKASFSMGGGTVSYGCDIEVFPGGNLSIGEGFFANIGLTLICAGEIKIGNGVTLGRNVTIRDYQGDHWMNKEGYRTINPVTIGDHVWLCEDSAVMPGVTIGSGSVVASHSLVTKDVPPNTLVAGIPARVIQENIQWKR